jgi:hypothetical protein
MSWETAKEAAWQAFGWRWWKLIVGFDIAKKALPVIGIAGLVGAAGYGVSRASGRVQTWHAAVATVAIVGLWLLWAAWRWSYPVFGVSRLPRLIAAAVSVAAIVAVWRLR